MKRFVLIIMGIMLAAGVIMSALDAPPTLTTDECQVSVVVDNDIDVAGIPAMAVDLYVIEKPASVVGEGYIEQFNTVQYFNPEPCTLLVYNKIQNSESDGGLNDDVGRLKHVGKIC